MRGSGLVRPPVAEVTGASPHPIRPEDKTVILTQRKPIIMAENGSGAEHLTLKTDIPTLTRVCLT